MFLIDFNKLYVYKRDDLNSPSRMIDDIRDSPNACLASNNRFNTLKEITVYARISRFTLLVAMFICFNNSSYAQSVVVYSNTSSFLGTGFSNGGATTFGSNTITRLVADDLIFGNSTPAGLQINSISFSVVNFNGVAVTARPIISLYADTAGLPGTLLANFVINPITYNAVSAALFTLNLTPSNALVTLGPGNRMWAGLSFDDNSGGTGASLTQMNNLGQALFNPPTLGTSQDLFFLSTAAGVGNSSNPAGGNLFFGGNPVANFGWQFTVVAVPEPMTWALIGLSTMGSVAVGLHYRRKHRALLDQKYSSMKKVRK